MPLREIQKLFERNSKWVNEKLIEDKDYFKKRSVSRPPDYLWIGCSDSRVPASEIMSLGSGNHFVHRNIANIVDHSDMNCLSVIQYAVEVMEVKQIIVCGHYDCGGVKVALSNQKFGLIDNWLRNIKYAYRFNKHLIDQVKGEEEKFRLMCELNVKEQVYNVCNTSIVQAAWARGQKLSVHGLIYDVQDGLLKDLHICITSSDQIENT